MKLLMSQSQEFIGFGLWLRLRGYSIVAYDLVAYEREGHDRAEQMRFALWAENR